MKKCIFVAGVHGVGKTTFSNQLTVKLNLTHYSASQLIRDYNSKLFFVDKCVTDVESNQDVLINSVLQNVSEDLYILDGHFTLLKKDNIIEKIPKSTFEKLCITKVILLLEHPIIIYHRIKDRDKNTILSLEKIEKMQQCELDYAKEVCNCLNIPLIILENSSEAKNFLNEEILH